jgi:hypothetical protein
MPDGPRAAAAEQGFYAAWGLLSGRPRRDGDARNPLLHRRNPAPNPISVSLAVLRDLNPDEYVVAEKTDGVRYALLLCGDEAGRPMAVMIDRAGRKFQVAVRAAARFFGGSGTLLDGELAWERSTPEIATTAPMRPLTAGCLVGAGAGNVRHAVGPSPSCAAAGDVIAAPDTLVYWAFDAVCVAGVSQRDADYETRIELVQRLLLPGRDADDLVEAEPGANVHGLEFRPKPCVAARLVDSVWSQDAPRLRHGSDGLVLTPLRDPIRTGTHWRQFKWKHKHTFDLQLRGRQRDDGRWLWGLYYLEADWTVPTADALARGGRLPLSGEPTRADPVRTDVTAGASEAHRVTSPADTPAPVARYLNACEGIPYRRSSVARASLDRALAAAQRRNRGALARPGDVAGPSARRAPSGTNNADRENDAHQPESNRTNHDSGVDGGQGSADKGDDGDDDECLVVFVLQNNAALDAIVKRALDARPGARRIKCIVECEGSFVAAPPGWTPPVGAPRGGVRILRCAVERLRTDKSDPNVRYTVRQTILNIDESITYATVRAALCRPRGPVL